MCQTQDIERPHPPVFQHLPYHVRRKTFAVVHIRFRRIIAKDSIHYNNFLSTISWVKCESWIAHGANSPFIKPTIGSEPRFGLRGTWRHHEKGCHTDDESENAFDEEEVTPTSPSTNSSELEQASRHERSDDGGHVVGDPEPG